MDILALLKPIHIASGATALLSGLVAMSVQKGRSSHRIWGKIFFFSMTITCILGLNAGIFRPGYTIFIPIALISFYQVATGYRILYIKQLHLGQKAKWVDWLLTLTMLLTSFAFIAWGISSLQSDSFLALVLFAFSSIGLYCCGVDIYHYLKKPTHKSYWLFTHIFRMSHGFIAALTAFLVNNSKWFSFLPQVLLLILPIAIGQPIISLLIWRYKRKVGKLAPVLATVRINKEGLI
jgi:uncharacterized membrane protein